MNWANTLTRPLTWMGIGAVIVGGAVWAQSNRALPPRDATSLSLTPALTSTMGGPRVSPNAMEEVFVNLADRASKAVVHITSDTRGLSNDQSGQTMMMGGEGSGFVYRADGWIVTNEHVVEGKKEVRVILADGRELLGKVTPVSDPQLDLAVVKVDASGLETLEFSPEKLVRPGQYAIAVGAPFGLENSVTIGHVSAISRQGTINDPRTGAARGYTGMIQTDASINPGNSGGPLIDIEGRVIGINTSIYSTTGGNNGIGFAIPSRVVKEVVDELITKGKFDRGLLGVVPRDLK
ncbi:MAG: S1C family serine protease, partial [Fimbriimonadaceae bacterium]